MPTPFTDLDVEIRTSGSSSDTSFEQATAGARGWRSGAWSVCPTIGRRRLPEWGRKEPRRTSLCAWCQGHGAFDARVPGRSRARRSV